MTSLTPTELADAVAKIAALDAKRTQGEITPEWFVGKDGAILAVGDDANWLVAECRFSDSEGNAPFIATAPLMAQVIRQLWAEREANRAVMEQARDGLESIRDACINSVGAGAPAGQVRQYAFDASFKALTALDAALGRV